MQAGDSASTAVAAARVAAVHTACGTHGFVDPLVLLLLTCNPLGDLLTLSDTVIPWTCGSLCLLLIMQPVDPLDLWTSPPFEAQLKQIDGQSYFVGRGVDDDKGATQGAGGICN
jgi:hypothetical protein